LFQLAQTVWSADDAVTALQGRVKPRLAAVRDIGLRCRLVLEDVTNLSSHNLTDDIGASLLRTQTLSIRFPTLAAELEVLTLAAEEKEGILYNLTPAYRQNLFAGTRAAASLGVTAAQAWANVAAGVREAQAQADQATRNVAAAAALARGPTPMERVAAKGKVASETLRRRGKEVLAKAEELRTQLDHLRRGADVVSVVLRGVGWQERDLGARPVARVAETLAAADEQADRVYATTRALYDEASELRRKVRYSLRRQLAELQKHGDTALGAAQEHVSQIRGNTVRGAETAEALATAAAARARQHDAAAATLSPALRALRDKVLRAKHAADSISVSLTSVFGAAGCSRGYSVSSASGAVSRIALAVSFENTVRDGPLLSVLDNTQDKERYMKLSVDNKRLHMAWDLGAGEGIIIHPEALQPTHDDADHTSYRIEIERIWNTVHLKVERAGGSGVTASNSSSTSAVSLTSSQLWLGAPSGVGLPGCVHALYADDNTVGLWNFHEQPKEAQCTGCTQRWYGVSRGGEPTMVWFNGRGYAELRRSRLRPADRRQFSIAFTFRTRDENALLFSAVDVANNRSVSVVLRACRVEFIVQYSGARLRIAAGGAHCDNRPKHVQAIRVFATNKLEKVTSESALSPGSLRVNGEETLGSPSPPVQTENPDGLLLFRAPANLSDNEVDDDDGDDKHYLALVMVAGELKVIAAAGKDEVRLKANGTKFDDKRLHTLRLVRDQKKQVASGVLPGNAYPARSGGLYLGGTAGQGAKEKRIPEVGFKGTVADFVVDSKLIGLETALKWSKAQLGRGEQSPRAPPRAEPRALHALNDNSPCTKTPSFTVEAGAVKFGDARWSHAMLRTPRRAAVLAVTLQIRTYAEDGLLLLGSKNKPKHYTALVVRDGRLRLVVRGRKRKEVALPSNITTGEWKSVSMRVSRAHAWVQTSGGGAGAESSTLHVAAAARAQRLYVGGMPPPPTLPNIPKSIVRLGGFRGCVRRVAVNSRAEDLVRDERAHRGVGQCFPNVERGAYFGGESHIFHHHRAEDLVRDERAHRGVGQCFPNVERGAYFGGESHIFHHHRAEDLVRDERAHRGVGQCFPNVERGAYFGGESHIFHHHRAEDLVRDERAHRGVGQCFPNVERGAYFGGESHIFHHHRAEDLVRDERAHRGGGQCFPNVERGAYFGGDAYASWSSTWSSNGGGSDSALELALSFRTTEPGGVLLAATGLLLEVNDGAVKGIIDTTEGGKANFKGCIRDVTIGTQTKQWNDMESLHNGIIDTTEGGKANFKGCIRDVTIGTQTKQWNDMESLHNVLMDSCPISQ
ncbi:Uncharacterized protein OBRU01_13791, partial [Operophtera brumata]